MLVVRFNDKNEIYLNLIIYKVNIINIRKRDKYGNVIRKF